MSKVDRSLVLEVYGSQASFLAIEHNGFALLFSYKIIERPCTKNV
jgi:hypothetical protein